MTGRDGETAPVPTAAVDAVIFDLGGVLARNGRPSDLAARFPDHDPDTVIRLVMGPYGEDTDHPWHQLERGEISLQDYRERNAALLEAAGVRPPTSAGSSGVGMRFEPNEPVVRLVRELRAAGFRLGVLTNNVRELRPLWWDLLPFEELFDDVVDSHEVGLRKPDPAIYRLALERLGTRAARTAFLDDIASNVATAEQLGMVGVLVDDDPTPAVATVRALAGLG